MSDTSQGEGWWIASDGKWYPPHLHPDYVAPPPPPTPSVPEPAALPPTAAPSSTPPEFLPVSEVAPAGAPTNPETTLADIEPAGSPRIESTPIDALPAVEGSMSTAGGRSFRPAILALVGFVLLAGLAFIGWRAFGGGGEAAAGGATSPDGAIEQLVASVREGDVVGFVDVFDPDELEVWFGSFTPVGERLVALGEAATGERPTDPTIAREQFDQFAEEFLDVVDISVTGPGGGPIEYDVSPLDPEGRINRVRVTGIDVAISAVGSTEALVVGDGDTVQALDLAAIDGAGLELRDEPFGLFVRAFAPDQETVEEVANDVHLDLVTVEKDGNWYINVGYTVMHNVWANLELTAPDYGRAFRLVDNQTGGGETPEQAVRALIQAAETLDYNAMISLTDPLGLPYLHDFAPAIDREVDPSEVRNAADELELRIRDLSLRTTTWEDRTLVAVEAIGGDIAGGTFNFDARSWCFDATSPDGEVVDGCLESDIEAALEDALVPDEPIDIELPAELGIVVVERNGRWFIDPMGTIGHLLDVAVEATEENLDLDELIAESSASQPVTVNGVPEDLIISPGTIVGRPESTRRIEPSDSSTYVSAGFDLERLTESFALVEIRSSGAGLLPQANDGATSGTDWAVVWDQRPDEPAMPAVTVETDSAVTFTVEPITIVRVDEGPFDGRIETDGRPIVFESAAGFSPSWVVTGMVDAEPVDGWTTRGSVVAATGVALDDQVSRGFSEYVIVHGEPGAEFTIDFSG